MCQGIGLCRTQRICGLRSAHIVGRALQTRRRRVTGDRDDDLLVAALEEVIYLLETTGEAPVDVNLSQPTEVST